MRILKMSARTTVIILILLTTAICPTRFSHAAESAMDTGAVERALGSREALDGTSVHRAPHGSQGRA